jgi:hypothetical protein
MARRCRAAFDSACERRGCRVEVAADGVMSYAGDAGGVKGVGKVGAAADEEEFGGTEGSALRSWSR